MTREGGLEKNEARRASEIFLQRKKEEEIR